MDFEALSAFTHGIRRVPQEDYVVCVELQIPKFGARLGPDA
jgi:hypothetical protein